MSSNSSNNNSMITPSACAATPRNRAYERHTHTLSESPASESEKSTNPITLTRFIQAEQALYSKASGSFTMLLNSIQLACKMIAASTRKAGISNLYGLAGGENKSGDEQKKLDVLSNEIMVACLTYSEQCAILGSEENDEPIIIEDSRGKYCVVFDPLDGSSNIDCNLSIGTIFGIYRMGEKRVNEKATLKDLLLPGNQLVAAGYCSYDASTMLALTSGNGVNAFTLDPNIGEFVLTHRNIRIPDKGKIYSVNEGNRKSWDRAVTECVDAWQESGKYSLRYVGSMVGDVHRTLLYGGIFFYPADKKSKQGKLRLLYECNPISMLVEQAGGASTTGRQRVLDVIPTQLHERSPIFVGSKHEVNQIIEAYKRLDQGRVLSKL